MEKEEFLKEASKYYTRQELADSLLYKFGSR